MYCDINYDAIIEIKIEIRIQLEMKSDLDFGYLIHLQVLFYVHVLEGVERTVHLALVVGMIYGTRKFKLYESSYARSAKFDDACKTFHCAICLHMRALILMLLRSLDISFCSLMR